MALLLLLHEANALPRNGLGVGLSAVHVHHGLRGDEADADLALAKGAWLDFMGRSLFVCHLAEFFRQPPVESLVQPAEKFSRADIASGHRGQPGFHLRLNFYMGDMLDLKGPLSGVGGKILPDRRVNVSRPRAMTFDEVRIVAVH